MFFRNGQYLGSGVPKGTPTSEEGEKKVVASPAVARSIKKAAQAAKVGAPEPKPVLTETEVEADTQAEQSRADNGDEAEQPKEYAPKGDWVDYAVTQGADRDEAESATKAELIELYGKGS